MTQEEELALKERANAGDLEARLDYFLYCCYSIEDYKDVFEENGEIISWDNITDQIKAKLFQKLYKRREILPDDRFDIVDLVVLIGCLRYGAINNNYLEDSAELFDIIRNGCSSAAQIINRPSSFKEDKIKDASFVCEKYIETFNKYLNNEESPCYDDAKRAVAEAYYLLAVINKSHPESIEYYKKAIENGSDGDCAPIFECYQDGDGKELENALGLNNSIHWHEFWGNEYFRANKRKEYNAYIRGLIAFEKEEYSEAYERFQKADRIFDSDKYRAEILFGNLGGNCFSINAANDLGVHLGDCIDQQKERDKTHAGAQTAVVEIPELLSVLKNENEAIFKRFNDFLGQDLKVYEKEALNSIKVVFSYEKKEHVYKPSVDEILEYIRQIFDFLENESEGRKISYNRPDYINKLHAILGDVSKDNYKERVESNSEELNRLLLSLIDVTRGKAAHMFRELGRLLRISKWAMLGTYSDSNKTIMLYLSNIYNECKEEKLSQEIRLLGVYAHEMFHAFHHMRIGNSFTGSKENRIVEESLASYFEYSYVESGFKSHPELYPKTKRGTNSQTYFCRVKNKYCPEEERIYSNTEKICFDIEKIWDGDIYINPYSGASYIDKCAYSKALFKKIYLESETYLDLAFKTIKFFYDLELDEINNIL